MRKTEKIYEFPWDRNGRVVRIEAKSRKEAKEKLFGLAEAIAKAILGEQEQEDK